VISLRRRAASASPAPRDAAHRLSRLGIDLAGYTIAEVLADLDECRVAFGHPHVDLLSESYGTRLALLSAQSHPLIVRRSVLVGVNPPGRFVWDPATVDAQLGDWSVHWHAADPARHDDDLAAVIRRASDGVPRRWLGARIDLGKAKILTFVLMFQRRSAAVAFDAWQAAANGDFAGLALMATAYDIVIPRMLTWGDFLNKAFSADHDPACDYEAMLGPPGVALGSPLSLLFFGSSHGWPVHGGHLLRAGLRRGRGARPGPPSTDPRPRHHGRRTRQHHLRSGHRRARCARGVARSGGAARPRRRGTSHWPRTGSASPALSTSRRPLHRIERLERSRRLAAWSRPPCSNRPPRSPRRRIWSPSSSPGASPAARPPLRSPCSASARSPADSSSLVISLDGRPPSCWPGVRSCS
jgi:pimeloyl-ACP methyl ester carboxylesterase